MAGVHTIAQIVKNNLKLTTFMWINLFDMWKTFNLFNFLNSKITIGINV